MYTHRGGFGCRDAGRHGGRGTGRGTAFMPSTSYSTCESERETVQERVEEQRNDLGGNPDAPDILDPNGLWTCSSVFVRLVQLQQQH